MQKITEDVSEICFFYNYHLKKRREKKRVSVDFIKWCLQF